MGARAEEVEDAAPARVSPSAKVESEALQDPRCIVRMPFVQNIMTSKGGFSKISALQVRAVPQRQQ